MEQSKLRRLWTKNWYREKNNRPWGQNKKSPNKRAFDSFASELEDLIEQGGSFTKFPVFASAFDLLLQSNNARLEILNVLFFLFV